MAELKAFGQRRMHFMPSLFLPHVSARLSDMGMAVNLLIMVSIDVHTACEILMDLRQAKIVGQTLSKTPARFAPHLLHEDDDNTAAA